MIRKLIKSTYFALAISINLNALSNETKDYIDKVLDEEIDKPL